MASIGISISTDEWAAVLADRSGGGGPPPFVPSLDFSDDRNSMYLTLF
ncbi:MAG: hypothetical protein ACK52I_37540 [Pseudomonadota bacterium]|jgi:hypothetical protein